MFKTDAGHVVRTLTIAGSDSGGGAGIQADLKTFHQFDVYGMSVITALTAQNTLGVQDIFSVSPDFVQSQLQSVADDIGMDAIKTGMLHSADIIDVVAEFLSGRETGPLVVDPVMVAKGGSPLLQPAAIEALVSRLLPLATVVTPNLPEAEVICGYRMTSWASCHQAARDIARFGPRFVVIKGGHAPEGLDATPPGVKGAMHAFKGSAYATDLVYDALRDECTYFVTPRVNSEKTHGTGCTYSAAVTALLARGTDPLPAIGGAKVFVSQAITHSRNWDVGHGHGPTDHSVSPAQAYEPQAAKFNLFEDGAWSIVDA